MLTEEHFELFRQFRIKAMGDKLREMVEDESYDRFTFEEKMEMLIDAEAAARRERKVAKLVKDARFKDPSACVEDVVYLPDRTLAKDRINRLARCEWIGESEVVVVISKTGCGKSFVVQALGNAACRRLIPVRYTRLADICDDLNRARAAKDGSYFEKMDAYKSVAPVGRRLHDDADIDAELGRPVRDHGGARGPPRDRHRLAARAERVVPAHRGRADGGLDPQPHRNRCPLHRSRGAEHARVLRQEEAR